jgi:ribosomal protein S12 methylthiotransferase
MKTIDDLKGLNYFTCTACMSVLADTLSWANANIDKVTKNIDEAENIIIPSCQVTDLAILNDFRHAEALKLAYPEKNVFITGCLAQRQDIDLPNGIERLEQMRCNYQHIKDKTLVNFAKPFWIKNFEDSKSDLSNGNLFRNSYPLRIGKGCSFNCTYCTIRITRGKHEIYNIDERLIEEFLSNEDVVLIADSPTEQQIKDWCNLAIDKNKSISIRNIEPQVAIHCIAELTAVAKKGLLKIFHCPIQSANPDVLKDMGRHVDATLDLIEFAKLLKSFGVIIATNIIIDYKDFPNNSESLYAIYDYVSWNPLWNGIWDRKKAEERFRKYLNFD